MSRTSCAVAMRICVAFLVLEYVTCDNPKKYNEETGKKFLLELNEKMSKLYTENTLASWEYESNLTDHNLEHQVCFFLEVFQLINILYFFISFQIKIRIQIKASLLKVSS